MLMFQGHIDKSIAYGVDDFENRPNVYTKIFVLGYRLMEHFLELTIADNNYISCGDIILLRHEGYNDSFQKLMRDIHAIHRNGSISIENVEDFQYLATCEWRYEYQEYFITKIEPIMDSYLEVI